ncbi:MAG: lysophospholipid acyltransferase family protein [Thermoanaerobaculales bacterium]|nr:lysophospholipid acyltransferase family protein [Thermoanaerobaculales bacterium]
MTESEQPKIPGVLVAGPNPKTSQSKRPLTRRRRALHRLAVPLTLGFMRTLWATYRFRIEGEKELLALIEEGEPFILVLWHGEVFAGSWYLDRLTKLGLQLTYIVSPSKDGEYAMRLVEKVGAQAVRGSATRSGVRALRGLYRKITRDGGSPIILPDGPRGPRHHCKEAPLLLSQLSKAPVVPFAVKAPFAGHLLNWDRMVIPLPFARVAIEVGQPFTVAKDLDPEAFEAKRMTLEKTLNELGRRAYARL